MLTQNCYVHPMLRLTHKPNSKLLPDKQDKHIMVPMQQDDLHGWLHGTVEQTRVRVKRWTYSCKGQHIPERRGVGP
jgi:hypothetical protein